MTLLLLFAACAKPPLDSSTPFAGGLPSGCAVGERCAYGGLLPLASAFAAKEACSCLFVAGRTEADCEAWVRVSPAVASFRVDDAERRVIAHALGMARVSARYVDEAHGCVFDE